MILTKQLNNKKLLGPIYVSPFNFLASFADLLIFFADCLTTLLFGYQVMMLRQQACAICFISYVIFLLFLT